MGSKYPGPPIDVLHLKQKVTSARTSNTARMEKKFDTQTKSLTVAKKINQFDSHINETLLKKYSNEDLY